jgi:hypothetical protein
LSLAAHSTGRALRSADESADAEGSRYGTVEGLRSHGGELAPSRVEGLRCIFAYSLHKALSLRGSRRMFDQRLIMAVTSYSLSCCVTGAAAGSVQDDLI